MNVRTDSQGVTLIEMIVVVAIIGLALATGMPNLLEYMQQQQLHAAAVNMTNHLNATRLLAMLKGVPHEVQMRNFEQGNYYQVVESNANRIVRGIGRVVISKEFGGVKLVEIPKSGKLKFSPAGTSASVTIELENQKKRRIKIIVSNGRVRMES